MIQRKRAGEAAVRLGIAAVRAARVPGSNDVVEEAVVLRVVILACPSLLQSDASALLIPGDTEEVNALQAAELRTRDVERIRRA